MSRNRKADFKRRQATLKARRRVTRAGPCPNCGKRLYRTQHDAIDALATIPSGYRIYECSGGWHTTSKKKQLR